MEIGRINGIPPVPKLRATRSAPDVAGVNAVELRKRERQEADIADGERAARGLEDEEEAELVPDEAEIEEPTALAPPQTGKISFFA
ncbi:MAG TPA: hypothetical protein VKB38_21685 [Terracidiphilus sp.]|nr:hypothetical protein [Terracidiphilus sp.]